MIALAVKSLECPKTCVKIVKRELNLIMNVKQILSFVKLVQL